MRQLVTPKPGGERRVSGAARCALATLAVFLLLLTAAVPYYRPTSAAAFCRYLEQQYAAAGTVLHAPCSRSYAEDAGGGPPYKPQAVALWNFTHRWLVALGLAVMLCGLALLAARRSALILAMMALLAASLIGFAVFNAVRPPSPEGAFTSRPLAWLGLAGAVGALYVLSRVPVTAAPRIRGYNTTFLVFLVSPLVALSLPAWRLGGAGQFCNYTDGLYGSGLPHESFCEGGHRFVHLTGWQLPLVPELVLGGLALAVVGTLAAGVAVSPSTRARRWVDIAAAALPLLIFLLASFWIVPAGDYGTEPTPLVALCLVMLLGAGLALSRPPRSDQVGGF